MRLIIYSAAILLVACNTTSKQKMPGAVTAVSATDTLPAGGSEKLYASRWGFTQVAGTVVRIGAVSDAPFLSFSPGQVNRVSGSTGCNRFNGTFELGTDNAMKFNPFTTTRKACAEGQAQEQKILAALAATTRFAVAGNELLLLKGKDIVVRLQPLSSPPSSGETSYLNDEKLLRLHEQFLSGIDFIATGNEPFWSVQIDHTKGIRFKVMGGDSISTPLVQPIRLQDVTANTYRVQTANGKLTLVVYDQPCVNDMSGDTLPKKVDVLYNDKRYAGCGRYLNDYRLNDTWVLRSINNVAVDATKLQKGAPTISFNLTENIVTGNSGCNGFSGRAEVMGRTVKLSRLAGTMMFCEDGGFEKRYYSLLSPKELTYEIANGILLLSTGNDKLEYKKID